MRSPAIDSQSVLSHTTISSAGVGAKSIYPRGPTFSLDTFATRDFVVREFIESLSDGAAPATLRRSDGTLQVFDPKPYIRAFEHALTRLSQLSDRREAHEEELANAVQRAESQHKQQCAALQARLDQALDAFNHLNHGSESSFPDDKFTGISTAKGAGLALQIGAKLEELDGQKRRADDAKFLLQCWQDVSERGDLSHLEDVRRLGGGDGKVKCAHVARQLLEMSGRVQGRGYDQANVGDSDPASGQSATVNGLHIHNEGQRVEAKVVVEKFLERLEKDLLEQFDECKRQHNEHGMRECATALYDFGDGASVIARYVNQHEFFLERAHLIAEDTAADDESWEMYADPTADTPGPQHSLQSLMDEVKLVLQEESFTMKQVFPFHDQVLMTFLQRVFQQLVQQKLESILDQAQSVSSLAFLRVLQATKNYISSTIEELKNHGLTEHPEPASVQVSITLDQQFEDLFIPYLAGTSYIEQEKRNMDELYGFLLLRFTTYHSRRRKMPTTYLGSLGQRNKEGASTAGEILMDSFNSRETPSVRKTVLTHIAGIGDTNNKSYADIDVVDSDGLPSLSTAKLMLGWLAEAVGRALELSGGVETPKEMAVLLRLLLHHLGETYLETSLDAANDSALTQETSKNEPDLTFISEVRTSVSILKLMLTVIELVLLPLIAPNVAIHRELRKVVASFVSKMEDKIGSARLRAVAVTLGWAGKLLQRQSRLDFRPKEDGVGLEQLQTPTCAAVFAFMVKCRNQLQSPGDGRNTELLFSELAVGFRSLLLDHFKKFQVNLAGGLMVSKDITKYIELLRTFPTNAAFQHSLESLMEIGNIFVIGPEALRDRLRGDSSLVGIGHVDLRQYIQRREDANSVGVQAVLNAI